MTSSGARSHEARPPAARSPAASSPELIHRDDEATPEPFEGSDLVARCLSGEGAAAHALHEKYYPAAAAFLRKLGARPDEMEDACQEVFLQFFRYLPSFRGEAQIKTWLFRLCISEARRARRRRRVRASLATLLGRELPHEAVVPPATASEATLRRRVESGLDLLSEGHRLVFVLLEMEGLPANQVAELARCSEATVWRRVGEVRRRCREMLGLGTDWAARRGVGMRSLRDESEAAADGIADANQAFEPAPGEQAAAWSRLQREMQSRWAGDHARAERRRAPRAGWRLLAGAGALASLAASIWLVVRPHPNTTVVPRAPVARAGALAVPRAAVATAAPPAPHATSLDRAPIERLPAPVALAPGRSWLAAGVRARLAPRGAAMVRLGSAASRVVSLLRGRIDIDMGAVAQSADVAPSGGGATASPDLEPTSPPPARVEVQVASYRLEPDSGRFSVLARGEKVDVVVHRGKLAVWSSRRLLATVVAGQRWTNLSARAAGRAAAAVSAGDGSTEVGVEAAAAPASVEAPSLEPGADSRATTAAEGPDCARLTRGGDIDGALACLTRASERSGLVGELALMELARIRRDVKGDLAGAERALAEHRRRFPRGALSDEAAGARVELLVRLARPAEALAEATHLGGGDALFWRAVCLAKLGRGPEAARAFDEYLARPDGKRHAEAGRMRRELAP